MSMSKGIRPHMVTPRIKDGKAQFEIHTQERVDDEDVVVMIIRTEKGALVATIKFTPEEALTLAECLEWHEN